MAVFGFGIELGGLTVAMFLSIIVPGIELLSQRIILILCSNSSAEAWAFNCNVLWLNETLEEFINRKMANRQNETTKTVTMTSIRVNAFWSVFISSFRWGENCLREIHRRVLVCRVLDRDSVSERALRSSSAVNVKPRNGDASDVPQRRFRLRGSP